MSHNLDSFVQSARPPPPILATSQEIRDRGSTFTAYAFRAASAAEALACVKHLKFVVHASKPATHEMSAWRCMALKKGHSGLGGPDDFELMSGSDDDGESWAGGKILKVLQTEGVIDAVVIVTRWYAIRNTLRSGLNTACNRYGGTMLGPVRFTHIETCAREVCRIFKKQEEMDDCMATLSTLDDILLQLREELATLKPAPDTRDDSSPIHQAPTKFKNPNYSALIEAKDAIKAKRLIAAREQAIENTKKLIARAKLATK